MSDEPSEALKAYSEQCEAWERMGVINDAPEYEEWLEQQYSAHRLEITSWRDRWTRKTERVHELEAAIAKLKKQLQAERGFSHFMEDKYSGGNDGY